MKKQLRQGDANVLNIYTDSFCNAEDNEGILLGYSTFPAKYMNNPTDVRVIIRHYILPRESGAKYGVSKDQLQHILNVLKHIITHEIGHWVSIIPSKAAMALTTKLRHCRRRHVKLLGWLTSFVPTVTSLSRCINGCSLYMQFTNSMYQSRLIQSQTGVPHTRYLPHYT